jgi:hypothetical protein
LHRNCLLEHVIEEIQKGRENEAEDVNIYWTALKIERTLEIERVSTKSLSLENSLWK